MSSSFSVWCFLAQLPGPPSIHFQNITFYLWPINKRKCPEFDPYRDTIFHLYSNKSPFTSKIMIPYDDESLIKSGIDFSRKTIMFFHGFTESYKSDDAQSIKNAYLQTGEYNEILVQNERLLAVPYYVTAARNCKPIGRYAAQFIDYLVSRGLNLKDLHVIGLSLGGQIAGLTGQFLKSGKLSRITALDPAGPLFDLNSIEDRLDSSDANFVDVIYTNSGVFGMKEPVGHANFWPNGGTKQPGCHVEEIFARYGFSLPWLLFCQHYRSYQLYVESIKFPYLFRSVHCNNNAKLKFGFHKTKSIAYMGIKADASINNIDLEQEPILCGFSHKLLGKNYMQPNSDIGNYCLHTGLTGINNG